jgi:hypothetical protein
MAKDSRTKAHFKTLLLVKTLKDNFEFEVSLINILVSSLEESRFRSLVRPYWMVCLYKLR